MVTLGFQRFLSGYQRGGRGRSVETWGWEQRTAGVHCPSKPAQVNSSLWLEWGTVLGHLSQGTVSPNPSVPS